MSIQEIINGIIELIKKNSWENKNFLKIAPLSLYITHNQINNIYTLNINVRILKAYEEPLEIEDEERITKLNDYFTETLEKRFPDLVDVNITFSRDKY